MILLEKTQNHKKKNNNSKNEDLASKIISKNS